jgi:hypothetical protein
MNICIYPDRESFLFAPLKSKTKADFVAFRDGKWFFITKNETNYFYDAYKITAKRLSEVLNFA